MAAAAAEGKPVVQEGEAVFPGDRITFGPEAPAVVVLGVGVLREGGGAVFASKAGIVRFERERARLWVDAEQKRYVPVLDDHVVGLVSDKQSEEYRIDLGGASTASLPVLAFDGATRKNRPNLQIGALVYARVVLAHKDMEPELSCAAPPGVVPKDWMTGQSLFGELKGGTVFTRGLSDCRSLIADGAPGAELLASLGEHVPFEVAVGCNGRIWLNAPTIGDVIALQGAICRALDAPATEHPRIISETMQSAQHRRRITKVADT